MKKLSFEEVAARVTTRGIIDSTGTWKPYILKTYINGRTPFIVTCPIYGDFTCSTLSGFFRGSNPGHPSSIRDRTKKTFIDKYGVDNPSKHPAIQEKIKQTCIKRYGVDNPAKHSASTDKAKATCLEKYGVDNPQKNKIIREKTTQTCIEKYGGKSSLSDVETWKKIRKTCVDRYGVSSPLLNKDLRRKGYKTIQDKIKSGTWLVSYGKTQKEIQTWLQDITGKVFKSNRTILDGFELDFYNEELKLAIEYCGLYWHNEQSPSPRPNGYHNTKRLVCEIQDIRLITIFEDEWIEKQVQVKNYLKFLLLPDNNSITLSNTLESVITKEESQAFLSRYAVDGYDPSSTFYFGLRHEKVLVSVLTFKITDNLEMYLSRYCSIAEYKSTLMFKTLFQYAMTTLPIYTCFVSTDNRWSQGEQFTELGFTLYQELSPGYTYSHHQKRYTKESQQLLCPPSIQIEEWCASRKYFRIWDCGTKIWIYNPIVNTTLTI